MNIEGRTAEIICEYFNIRYRAGIKVSFDTNDRDKLSPNDPGYSVLSISGQRSLEGIERINVISYFGGRTDLLMHWQNFSRKLTLQPDSMTIRTFNRQKNGGLKARKQSVTHSKDTPRGRKFVDGWHKITGSALQEAIDYGVRRGQAGKIEAMFGGLIKLEH